MLVMSESLRIKEWAVVSVSGGSRDGAGFCAFCFSYSWAFAKNFAVKPYVVS